MSIKKSHLVLFGLFLTLFIEVTNVPNNILIPIYGNIIGFVFILSILWRNLYKSKYAFAFAVIVYLFYGIYDPFYYSNSVEAHKSLFYALVSVALGYELGKKDYSHELQSMFYIYIIFCVFSFFIGIGVDSVSLIVNRIQGYMSEPSALAMMLCFMFWSYLRDGNYKRLAVIVIVSALTMSLTVYAIILVFYVLLLITQNDRKSLFKLATIAVVIFGLLFVISRMESDNWLISKASDAAIHIFTGGDDGRNTRSIDLNRFSVDQNQNEYSILLGNGPGYGVYFYNILDQLSLTTNIQSIVFFDFGYVGLSVLLLFSIHGLYRCKYSPYYYLYLSSLSYAIINSASGIVNIVYYYALLVYFILRSNVKIKKLHY